jgi:hypothetical protein
MFVLSHWEFPWILPLALFSCFFGRGSDSQSSYCLLILLWRFCPALWWWDSNIYLVFSAFTFRPTSLPSSIKVSVFFFMISMLSPSKSHGSAVGIAAGYRLDYLRVRVPFPVCEEFLLLLIVQTGSGAHWAFYSMDTRGFFPGVK